MHSVRATSRRITAYAVTAALIIGGAAIAANPTAHAATPAPHAATQGVDVIAISEGTVTWGVRNSWRGYAG